MDSSYVTDVICYHMLKLISQFYIVEFVNMIYVIIVAMYKLWIDFIFNCYLSFTIQYIRSNYLVIFIFFLIWILWIAV